MRIATWVLAGLVVSCNQISSSTGPELNVLLDDAGGLRGGAPVYVAGVQVGRVVNVKLESERARVAFQMTPSSGVTVHGDACVSVGHYGMSGEAHLRLEPGTTGAPVVEKGQINCVRPTSKLSEDAQRALDSMQTILTAAATGKGTIGRLLRDEKLADKVERYFDRATAELEPTKAPVPVPSAAPAPPKPPQPPSGVLDGRR